MARPSHLVRTLLTLLLIACLCGCGGASTIESTYDAHASAGSYADGYGYEEGILNEAADDVGTEAGLSAEKMTYSASVRLQSRSFDAASTDIDKAIEEHKVITLGDNTYQNGYEHSYRSRSIQLRVAVKDFDAFVDDVCKADGAKVLAREVTAQDMTKTYDDAQSRIELLQTQYDFYQKLVEEADDADAIATYTDRMFSLLDEIKSLENRKASIDTDVAYSLVTISLTEDAALAEADDSLGLWEQLKDKLRLLPTNIGAAFVKVGIFVIEAIPLTIYVVTSATFAFGILLLIRAALKGAISLVHGHRARTTPGAEAHGENKPTPPDA